MARDENDHGRGATAIADAIMQLAPADRSAYLDDACSGDARLRRAVEAEVSRRERPATNLTQILNEAQPDRPDVIDHVARVVDPEIHDMARRFLRREPSDPEVQTSVLADDAFFKVFGSVPRTWESRRHFWGAVANAMSELCKDYARRRNALKRGGGQAASSSLSDPPLARRDPDEAAWVAEALDRLQSEHPRPAQVVRLHYYADRSLKDVARMLDVSYRTVKIDWAVAREWLYRDLSAGAQARRG